MGLTFKPTMPASWNDAKRIVAVILQAAGGTLDTRTRLYKAFYRAHVEHLKEHGCHLSPHPVVCLEHGPGIDHGKDLLRDMESDGTIQVRPMVRGTKIAHYYTLKDESAAQATAAERASVHKALEWLGRLTATAASQKSHVDSRSWRLAREADLIGEPLYLELDALPEEEYARLDEAYHASKGLMAELFPAQSDTR